MPFHTVKQLFKQFVHCFLIYPKGRLCIHHQVARIPYLILSHLATLEMPTGWQLDPAIQQQVRVSCHYVKLRKQILMHVHSELQQLKQYYSYFENLVNISNNCHFTVQEHSLFHYLDFYISKRQYLCLL